MGLDLGSDRHKWFCWSRHEWFATIGFGFGFGPSQMVIDNGLGMRLDGEARWRLGLGVRLDSEALLGFGFRKIKNDKYEKLGFG